MWQYNKRIFFAGIEVGWHKNVGPEFYRVSGTFSGWIFLFPFRWSVNVQFIDMGNIADFFIPEYIINHFGQLIKSVIQIFSYNFV